ncbi:MAG: carboxypeptidase-like regulatory domain-containing protein [Planctomycetaceae bacterium]|nr:carboxypeptidase-like regulatory domain-containing protein [Planctomycetaceae bacterium]
MKIKTYYLPLLLLSIFLAGCSNAITVKGKVEFSDGQPLEFGKVVFENDKNSFVGRIGKDGNFSMGRLKDGNGIPRGNYRVYIAETHKMIRDNKYAPQIDKKFSSSDTSNLQFDIQKKTTDISIVVERHKTGKEK